MIHNHSSGKHRLWRKVLSVCIAFAMICSVSISAFAVEASSETANENIETVQSGSAEEAEELTATEAENDQSVDELQPEMKIQRNRQMLSKLHLRIRSSRKSHP